MTSRIESATRYIEDGEGPRIEAGARDLEDNEIVVWNACGFGATDISIEAGHMTWAALDKLKAAIAEAERRWRNTPSQSQRIDDEMRLDGYIVPSSTEDHKGRLWGWWAAQYTIGNLKRWRENFQIGGRHDELSRIDCIIRHIEADLSPETAPSAIQRSDEADKRDAARWRLLEHGCQWVSFIPTNGEQRSFDPRNVTGYAGDLEDMRAFADETLKKQLEILKEGAEALSKKYRADRTTEGR